MKKLLIAAVGLVAFVGTAHASDLEHNQKICDAFLQASTVIDCSPDERGIEVTIYDPANPGVCGAGWYCNFALQQCNAMVTKIGAISHHTYTLHISLTYNGGHAACGNLW
jgi:hypothetical protein